MPKLHTLRLTAGSDRFRVINLPVTPSSIQWNVRVPFPNLRILHLVGVSIPKSQAIFRGLQELTLHQQRRSRGSSLEDLLGALERCPDLVYLDLSFAGYTLPLGATTYPAPTRRVELNHLQTLKIVDDAPEIGQFLSSILIPATTAIDVQSRNSKYLWLEDLFPLLLPRYNTLPHLENHTSTWFTYRLEVQTSVEFSLENIHLSLSLSEEDCAEDDLVSCANYTTTFLLPFLGELPLNSVEKLEIHCSYHHTLCSEEWAELLPRVPSLRTLFFRHYHDGDEDLGLCHYLDQTEAGGGAVCPTLETLILSDLSFDYTYGTGVDLTIVTENLGMCLVDCLRAREARGSRLKELRIVEARGLRAEAADLLKGCADHVEVGIYVHRPHPGPMVTDFAPIR
jgi:hypothetical protein